MKQEILNKIEIVNSQISIEENSFQTLNPILKEVVGTKKSGILDSLRKYKYKLEMELNKIINLEEKERRQAPIREIMAKINENKKTQKELNDQLQAAKAMLKQDPNNQDALIASHELSTKIGDTSREAVKLVETQKELISNVGAK